MKVTSASSMNSLGYSFGIEQALQQQAANECRTGAAHLLPGQSKLDSCALRHFQNRVGDHGIPAGTLLDECRTESLVASGDGPGLGDDARPAAIGIVAQDDACVLAHEGFELGDRRAQLAIVAQPFVHARAADGQKEFGLALEVRVDRPFCDPGLERDLLQRRGVKAVAQEHRVRACDQARPRVGLLVHAIPSDRIWHTYGI